MNFKQPFFTLKISSVHCGYRLAVNGFPIDDNLTGEPVTIEHPINAWIKTGHNSFEIHHLNINTPHNFICMHHDGKLTMELRVKEFGSDESVVLSTTQYDAKQLARLDDGLLVDFDNVEALKKSISASSLESTFDIENNQKQLNETGPFKILPYDVFEGPHKALSIIHNVELETPFPLWKMFSADDLIYHTDLSKEDRTQMRIDLMSLYQPLWDALINKDTKKLESYFELRCNEYDIAYYTKPGQNRYELIVHLLGFINSDEWKPSELLLRRLSNFVSYNNKATWLHTPKRPLISGFKFKHTSADLETRIPMMWAQFDGKWQIVR